MQVFSVSGGRQISVRYELTIAKTNCSLSVSDTRMSKATEH